MCSNAGCALCCVKNSDQLDAVAQKKLVNFVHDLMTQYFDFVCRRVQLEVLLNFQFCKRLYCVQYDRLLASYCHLSICL